MTRARGRGRPRRPRALASTTRRRCSRAARQAVIGGTLVRNYDYHPDRIEATVLNSRLTRPVLGMSDCLWGLLDGDQRRRPGGGAGVRRAADPRRRVRDHARRPLPARDVRHGRAGDRDAPAPPGPRAVQPHARRPAASAATVFVGPDRAARVGRPAVATNHQEQVDWPEHARATRAASSASPRSRPPPRTRSSNRRCTRPSTAAASARSTRRSYQPAQPRRHLPLAADDAGTIAARLYARRRGPSDSGSVQTATSALVLGDLVAQEDLGLSLLSGGAGALDREVAGAHSIDVEHPTRFLERRWVMLTAGMRLKGSVAAQRALIEELDEGGISALGIGVDLVFKRVPPRCSRRRASGRSPCSRCRSARRSATSSASSTARCSPATCTPTSG